MTHKCDMCLEPLPKEYDYNNDTIDIEHDGVTISLVNISGFKLCEDCIAEHVDTWIHDRET